MQQVSVQACPWVEVIGLSLSWIGRGSCWEMSRFGGCWLQTGQVTSVPAIPGTFHAEQRVLASFFMLDSLHRHPGLHSAAVTTEHVTEEYGYQYRTEDRVQIQILNHHSHSDLSAGQSLRAYSQLHVHPNVGSTAASPRSRIYFPKTSRAMRILHEKPVFLLDESTFLLRAVAFPD